MKTNNISARELAILGLCWVPLAASAQETTDSNESLTLNPLTVTATLAPRTADETLSSVTVIDKGELQRQNPASLADIMRGQPGVDVATNGSYGQTASMFIRGTNSDATLLMIDGIRLHSATSGGAAWQYLDPHLFQRVEILRGPGSSLYGADAMGGVVQLFTPEGDGGNPQPRISVGSGSFNTQRYSASLSGGRSGTRYSFAGSRFTTDGTEVSKHGEDKGFDDTTGFARLSHTFDNGAEIGALGLRARGNTEYDGGNSNFVQQVAGIYGELPITAHWRSRLTLSDSRDELDDFADASAWGPASTSVINTRTQTARWQNDIDFGAHTLIAGIERSEDKVSGTTDYVEDSRYNNAAFAQALLDFDPLTVQTGLRYDDNEAYGDKITGNLALGYKLDEVHTLRASYATAFKAPTFNSLYYPDVGYYVGNPDLRPEKSRTTEVGLRGQYPSAFWDLAIYQTDADDLIVYAGTHDENVDRARMRGVELSSGAEVGAWDLKAALTWVDPKNRSGENEGNRLPRRASQSLRLDADRALGDWLLGGSWIAQNHRYDDAANDTRLAGFGLLNLRAGWQFAPLWNARLTVDNVFDKRYETAANYINAGRAAFVSVSFGA